MNIFIMILVAIFMLGYYTISAPNQQVPKTNTEYAVARADLHTIAQCAAAVHNAQIKGTHFNDVCVAQNGISSQFFCMNSGGRETECAIVKNKKPTYSYIVTTTAPLAAENINSMLEIMEEYYFDAGAFGVLLNGTIVSGNAESGRHVPKTILDTLKLTDGQLIYMTQYDIPDTDTVFATAETDNILCPTGTVKIYRFGRWQCIGYNPKTDCGGDMIWNYDQQQCVADESRKPLCAPQQTAVLVDKVWECINPFPTKNCPNNMVTRLNYNTMEWECVTDPNKNQTIKKCTNVAGGVVFGALGTTLTIGRTSCTDCEKMVIDPDTCASYCAPDPTKITNASCYPNANQCSGPNRAVYFGFPNRTYIANISELAGVTIPLDRNHSQNRRFNCLDCGNGKIDTDLSNPPYTAFCK